MRFAVLMALCAAGAAHADPLDDLPESGGEKPLPEADSPAPDDEDADFDGFEDDEDEVASEGSDTATEFREAQDRIGKLPPLEQLEAWHDYLLAHPNSQFKENIDRLKMAAEDALYKEKVGGGAPVVLDARPMQFSQGIQLESIEARERLQLGFDWGNPDWLNLVADYEHPLHERLSVHAGVLNRIPGWRVEPGVHFSPVYNRDTETIVTVIADVPITLNPAFVSLRPQVAVGQRLFDKLELQVQGGVEYESRAHGGFRYQGGGAAYFRAAPRVAAFVETYMQLQHYGWPSGSFYFHVTNFGMKFYVGNKDKRVDAAEVNLAGSVPYTYSWWQPYSAGAVLGETNLFLDDL